MITKGKVNKPDRIFTKRPGYVKTVNDFTLCTWNVRSLYRDAGLRLLCQQLTAHGANITAIQEMRWTGKGIIEKPNFNTYYSCHEKHHIFGTGFIVDRKMKPLVIDFKPVNERLCTIRIKGKFHNYTIVNVHAPTEETDDEQKERFYTELEDLCTMIPKGDIKMIVGDFNAKLGREQTFLPTIGNHSLHENTNDNGMRLITFAVSLNLVIGSTCFPHKDIHKMTWCSPDGKTFNQIDHVLLDSRHYSNLLDVRTHRGANIDSDHFLVVAKIRARISNLKYKKHQKENKYNIQLLLGYADDIDIIARSGPEMESAYLALEEASNGAGLTVNAEKTTYMHASRSTPDINEKVVTIGEHNFAVVDSFVYLGSMVTRENEISVEIRRRIMAANKCYFSLLRYFRSKLLTRKIKLLLYKTLLRPVLIYGSETWVLSKGDENALLVFERKILRRIFGAVCEDNQWRSRYNQELYDLYKELNVAGHIKLNRLRWAGHVERMDEARVPKNVMASNPEGRRSRGRPKLRWIDGVNKDAKKVGIANWKSVARDRPRWKKLLDQAKAHKGL
ncbi:PREDICTED: uncharacterized protein LOC106123612 [Papilio xuthus]|uniref:Uncharacterized protein LOC106123612 n=1 Tax=Papilio xuthus TaxID=66420 RepID=A0AAJ6ZM71_PAPXU|nr:PREDICTED: uncharacterized protein LOC106123612 [Papilio xuthus]